ncbi:MAG: succinylglutamate desuccinylase/aspartoacylase family protein, partial [Emcibacteraceae bacterium]|nr:succinylglutamate desuccinylase/aspartoacylase family protein [Emcibacteraceae bacterium]
MAIKFHKILLVLTLMMITAFQTNLYGQENVIMIENISAAPGKLVTGEIEIKSDQNSTIIPITIVNSKKPGPTLVLVAGIHGSEYSPIIALQNLMLRIDPENISGAVIAVHIANMPSYIGRTIYNSPLDGKNLNRSFPGKIHGTITERIAYFLTSEVYPLADAVLDIHSGDGNEQL